MPNDAITNPDLLRAATWYACHGWPVIPLHTVNDKRCTCGRANCSSLAKHPRTSNGLKDATIDEDTIRRWWERWPDANIGIRTGGADDSGGGAGVFVLDIDPRHGGEASLAELASEHGQLRATVEAITGSGGRHLVFVYPTAESGIGIGNRSNVLPGLDVRGDGGYIVAPPSMHASGYAYRWRKHHSPYDRKPVEAPAWLLELVQVKAQHKPEAQPAADANQQRAAAAKCLATLLQIDMPDHQDGSKRLYTSACRCVEYDLTDAEAVATIRALEQVRQFPKNWSDADIIRRIRDAERTAIRGKAFQPARRDNARPAKQDKVPKQKVEPYLPFPVDALPEPVRAFVAMDAQAIGCDPSYIALPLLSALASAIGNTRRIQLKRGWTEPAIIWAAIVGDSGTLKSPALELALHPVRQRQHNAMRDHDERMEHYRDDMLRYERDLQKWKRANNQGEPPTQPDEPIVDRCWCDDSTVEALAVLLLNQWRGLLMVRDELAGWLGGFDRYAQGKGSDVAKWLEMFGGRSMLVDRKTGRARTIYVPRAAVSIAGGIQPETLRRALGLEHRENGLAARLLLTCPPRKPKRWTEAEIPAQTEAAVEVIFERLFSLDADHDEKGDPRPRIVTLTPKGKQAWITFYNKHAEEQAELSGDLSAAWSKLEGYAARLALVVHFVRWAANDPTLDNCETVDEMSIEAGVTLSRWFGYEDCRVYAILGESDDDRELRRLVELIQRKGGAVSVRDWQRSRTHKTATDAEAELNELVEAGYANWHVSPQAGPGRPTKQCVLDFGGTDTDKNPVDGSEVGIMSVSDPPEDTDDTPESHSVADEEWGEL